MCVLLGNLFRQGRGLSRRVPPEEVRHSLDGWDGLSPHGHDATADSLNDFLETADLGLLNCRG